MDNEKPDKDKPSETHPNEYHQTTVRADWKGRPSSGARGDSGPDDVQHKPAEPEDQGRDKSRPR